VIAKGTRAVRNSGSFAKYTLLHTFTSGLINKVVRRVRYPLFYSFTSSFLATAMLGWRNGLTYSYRSGMIGAVGSIIFEHLNRRIRK
jgi:hypothetical protein